MSRRTYSSPLRASQSLATRHRVLVAAWELFTTRGFAATTVGRVAARAEVSVDTLYSTVGRKPDLLRAVVESAISGTDETVPAEQRDYVNHMRAASGATVPVTFTLDAARHVSSLNLAFSVQAGSKTLVLVESTAFSGFDQAPAIKVPTGPRG